ncbi:MAG: hypothetical protein J7647_20665 [Cyanobacteria bacterium SBLK]|nr:hypothetical protein [Cyanobacteria bacterium SBLK]
MPTFEIICLANSLKHGGRCIAGFKTDGSGWLRPVSSQGEGTLYDEHYTLACGRKPELFSILKIECDRPHSRNHQPENWIVSDRQWEFVGWPTTLQLNQLLKKEIQKANHSSTLLGTQSDRISLERLQNDPSSASLCLIKPKHIIWKIDTFSNKRKFRVIFALNGIEYNLNITDSYWRNLLKRLDDGEYSCKEAIEQLNLENFAPDKFLFTISLGEPFQIADDESFYCYKLVSAVINATYVKAFLKQTRNTFTADSNIFARNRDLELSKNKIIFSVKPLINQAVKTCWDCCPEERRSLPVLRRTLQELLEQTLEDFKQNVEGAVRPRNSTGDRLARLKEQHPQAYEKWTMKDDDELRVLFGDGMSIQDLANYFQRQPGGIRSRLKKLDLVE